MRNIRDTPSEKPHAADHAPSALSFRDVGVSRRGRRLLRGLTLEVSSPGLLFLVGPGGEGKSSLLAALAGDRNDGLSLEGDVGLAPGAIAWVPQHAEIDGAAPAAAQLGTRFGVESSAMARLLAHAGFPELSTALAHPAASLPRSARRLIAVLAALSQPATLYLADEPTADMDDAHVRAVRARLLQLARGAMVIVATHNRQDCLALGGDTALVAGGTLQELAASGTLFRAPSTAAARTYVETGNCSLPVREPAPVSDGIWWLVAGLLCGMGRPGMVGPVEHQCELLRIGGVRHLVCLEERREYPMEPARRREIACHHFPIADLAPPSFSQAVDICRLAEAAIKANEGVAMHCRGGLGRTGTALAAVLIWFGEEADVAIDRVRDARPRAIQTPAQERFLREFASRIRAWH